MTPYVAPHSLDEFVRCNAQAGCEWNVLVVVGFPRFCDDHAPGWGLPQYLDIKDEAGEVVAHRTRHCSEHTLNECE